MSAPEQPRIPLSVPDLGGREREYLAACIDDNWVSSAGPYVGEVETRLAALSGREHGVACVSGTAAIHLVLVTLGIGPGDHVIVPDFTFAATANAVCHAGATPWFVDVDPATWTLDPVLVDRALGESGARVVLAVDVLGQTPDFPTLERVATAHGARVVEDAAGAIGARAFGRPAGSFGRAATFSFNGNKVVTAGGGGMIVTDDPDLAARARHLCTQARTGGRYRHDAVGFNHRMTNLNAAVLLAQLERLDTMLTARRRIAAHYDAALEARADLSPMPRAPWAETNGWLHSRLCPSPAVADDVVAHLEARGIEARVFWESLSAQPPYADSPHTLAGVAADLSGRVVSLPSSSSLTEAGQARVIAALDTWHGARDAAA